MFAGQVAPELAAVDVGPRSIQIAITLVVEVELALVDVARLQVDVDMGVVGILVDNGQGARAREGAVQVLVGQVSRPHGGDPLLARHDNLVIGARLAVAAPALPQFVLLALPGVSLQVIAEFVVVAGIEDVLREVSGQDRMVVMPGGRPARDVVDIGRARAATTDRDADEDPAHLQTRPVKRRRASVAAASALSRTAGGGRSPAFRRRAIWLRFTPTFRR